MRLFLFLNSETLVRFLGVVSLIKPMHVEHFLLQEGGKLIGKFSAEHLEHKKVYVSVARALDIKIHKTFSRTGKSHKIKKKSCRTSIIP